MNRNLEIEYKTMLTKEEYDRLLALYPEYEEIVQTNHYFRGTGSDGVFRFRALKDSYLFTHKTKTRRGRIEHEVTCDTLDLENPEILAYLSSNGIFPPFTELAQLTTVRREVLLPEEASFCMDENHYSGITDYEVEYEVCGPLGSRTGFIKRLKVAGIRYQKSPASKQKRAVDAATFNK